MTDFVKDLDELLHIAGKRVNLTKHLEKNYKENVHYIKQITPKKQCRGGQNKIIFLLTETVFELLKNSYNFRNRYIVEVSDTVKSVNIGMCIENQTVGFIENSFKGIIECKRQFIMGKYRIDLYFPEYKLAIECDENDHVDRDAEKEKEREEYIVSLGNKLIRYNPNTPTFDLSNILREINRVIMGSK
jgi:very-short-patch-repair endonuclease